VFTDVTPAMQIAYEEIFGPILSVFRFTEEQEVIDLTNGVDYGLTAGVFTNGLTRAHRLARALEAGNVYVNTWFGDTTQTPFGGCGIGREKGSTRSIRLSKPKISPSGWKRMRTTFLEGTV
jgi:aldehyde dehydrogenase (NAD+)